MVRPLPALLLFLTMGGCRPDPALVDRDPGEPLEGLTAEQEASFVRGRALFQKVFGPEEGLGPLFNQTGCASCHDLPSSGGHGAEPVRKATRFVEGRCDLLEDAGGDLLQSSVTSPGRAAGLAPEILFAEATGSTELVPPSLYGIGLVEGVPLEAITARADPLDRDGDGISGRLGTAVDGGVGRFGAKAGHATIASFVEDAARGEMGLSTPSHPVEVQADGRPWPDGADPAPDPEVDDAFLDDVVRYLTFLAPPRFRESRGIDEATRRRGAALFEEVGCAECHVPTWTTGPNSVGALDEVTFRAYSDFLLHDLGPALADICAPGAAPGEWRTPRLVGLSHRTTFLHDGRAARIADAVAFHGGEAAAARAAFQALPEATRTLLLRFLQSL